MRSMAGSGLMSCALRRITPLAAAELSALVNCIPLPFTVGDGFPFTFCHLLRLCATDCPPDASGTGGLATPQQTSWNPWGHTITFVLTLVPTGVSGKAIVLTLWPWCCSSWLGSPWKLMLLPETVLRLEPWEHVVVLEALVFLLADLRISPSMTLVGKHKVDEG